ncbi:hypothetical protein DPMN_104626 [Dreissena polymorpha]|uniref:Uncharacterized protein n=1 Tax=Dreissena polymorpha TaxID=45954 RepID=A0A9D4H851_DREPO|nr:hypothetical protein DPMN_104626 [Dreissena polymorpha]
MLEATCQEIVVEVLLPLEEDVLAGRIHLYRVLHGLASARQRVPETRRATRLKLYVYVKGYLSNMIECCKTNRSKTNQGYIQKVGSLG